MHFRQTLSRRSPRTLLVILALALASTVGFVATDATADVLVPAREAGGGGGSGFAGQIDETARAQNLDALSGGGIASQVDESARAANLDALTGDAGIAGLVDETERAENLDALTGDAGIAVQKNPHQQPF